ncbi:MAG: Asp-tRNA(Asn)/Glu-tRNA(Gln) amidotransferase subunit GatB [Methanotrichaceae archaeon]
MAENDVIIGLEVHIQLNKLKSKLFCSCSTDYHDAPPNTHTCPVCLGLPGTLPVINKKAVEYAIRVALALNCTILEETLFYRKNYYYPDLPKAFQITQYDYPLGLKGAVLINGDNGKERAIRINRVHMEEDPGRLIHAGTIDRAKYTMVDYNRCGMPLLEIVTEPDLRSPKESRTFLDKLKNILEYLDVFDDNLEGAMRVDSNISLAGGDRSEVKNITGSKGVEKALAYEITRQRNIKRRGMTVVQETRHYDELRGITVSIRSKVEANDYRYFPEADLVAMRIGDWVPHIMSELPELPDAKRERFKSQYKIADDHAKSLTSNIKVANFYEEVARKVSPKMAAVWIADVLKGELNYRDTTIDSFSPDHLVEIVEMLESKKITEKGAVEVIRQLLDHGGSPAEIVKTKGLVKAEDDAVLEAVNAAVLECSQAVEDYKNGNEKSLNFIVGQVMKKTRGRADPSEAHRLVKEALENL